MFFYLVFAAYQQFRKVKFLSLSELQGEADCEEVPLPISGVFLADNNGNWEGQNDFDYSRALYGFEFNRLETTESAFVGIIDIALAEVERINKIMMQNNLAVTILFWTMWTFISSNAKYTNDTLRDHSFLNDDKSHYLYLTGNILLVFLCGC